MLLCSSSRENGYFLAWRIFVTILGKAQDARHITNARPTVMFPQNGDQFRKCLRFGPEYSSKDLPRNVPCRTAKAAIRLEKALDGVYEPPTPHFQSRRVPS
jgi:hypothetical protein